VGCCVEGVWFDLDGDAGVDATFGLVAPFWPDDIVDGGIAGVLIGVPFSTLASFFTVCLLSFLVFALVENQQ
jgi:hypothetical protein